MDASEFKRLKDMFYVMLEQVSSFNPSRYRAEKSSAVPSSRHGSAPPHARGGHFNQRPKCRTEITETEAE